LSIWILVGLEPGSIEEFTLPLRDGELVDFRPVKQNDKETLQKGMLALSSKSRYFRFFSPILKLSELSSNSNLIGYFLSAVSLAEVVTTYQLTKLISPPEAKIRYYYQSNTLTYQDNPCPDIKTQSIVMKLL